MNQIQKNTTKKNMYITVDSKEYQLTHHAVQRMMERNISKEDIEFIIKYGYTITTEINTVSFKLSVRSKSLILNSKLHPMIDKLKDISVLVNIKDMVIISVMITSVKTKLNCTYRNFALKWNEFKKINLERRKYLGKLLHTFLSKTYSSYFIQNPITLEFILSDKIVHDGNRFLSIDEDCPIISFDHVLMKSMAKLKRNKICPIFHEGYSKLYYLLKDTFKNEVKGN